MKCSKISIIYHDVTSSYLLSHWIVMSTEWLFPKYTFACVLPLGTLSAEKALEPLLSCNVFPSFVKIVLVTLDPHVRSPETMPQGPFDDLSMKPAPDSVAVMVAQVPDVYHVPEDIMQPLVLPDKMTLR